MTPITWNYNIPSGMCTSTRLGKMDIDELFSFGVKFIERFREDGPIYASVKEEMPHLLKWPFASGREQLGAWIWYNGFSDKDRRKYVNVME